MPRIRLAVFDMDGTLLQARSCWAHIHEHFGTDNSEMLRQYIEHKVTDEEFVQADIDMWGENSKRPVNEEYINSILDEIEPMEGAEDLILALHLEGIQTAIISGGVGQGQGNNYTYQWYDGNNTTTPISGETSFVINNLGKVISTYRKIHLYDALGFKESKKMIAGSKISKPVSTSIGKTGMMICYDLRFPEMSRTLASSGTEILVVPSAWVNGPMKEEHWLTLNKSRAIENGCYVIAPDHLGHVYSGRSLAIDPYGRILLDMKKRQGIGYVNISLDKVHEVRKKLPLLKNRRTDIYSDFKI